MAERGAQRWFFDAWSWFYDLTLVQRATYWPVHDAVVEGLAESPPRRVLDIGCGTGQLIVRVGERFPRARAVGCDFSAGMLRQAAARATDVHWVCGDATRLPFADGTFDAVISTEAFHWFPDQAAALREMYRVLSANGRLLLALVNTPSPLVSDLFYSASRLFGEPFYWPSSIELHRRVEAAGFHVERQQRVFRIPGGLLIPPVLTIARRPDAKRQRRRRSTKPENKS